MNTDFRISITFTRHPNTRLLRKRYGLEAAWALIELWTWAAINRANGIFTGMNEEQIEAAADWNGESGELIKALTTYEWLIRNSDGVYELNQWAETNSWAADAENRSDKSRLLSMAKNYPELYAELTAQGATGISKSEYARLTAEYNSRGIIRSSSDVLRRASVAPAPVPVPASSQENEQIPDLENSLTREAELPDSPSFSEQPEPSQTPKADNAQKLYTPDDAPDIMKSTAELFLYKTGKEGLTWSDISALRTLAAKHYPSRVQKEIDTAVKRFRKRGQPLTALTLNYIAGSLQNQPTWGRKPKPKPQPQPHPTEAPQRTEAEKAEADAMWAEIQAYRAKLAREDAAIRMGVKIA